MNKTLTLLLALFCLPLGGCSGLHLFGAKVVTSEVVAEKPSDISAYVSVEKKKVPVGNLTADNFRIFENKVPLNEEAIGFELLPRESVAAGHTVLLLDLSGAPDDAQLRRISRGAAHFAEKVTTTQPVTVVAFDGSARAREVARFSKVAVETKRPLPDLGPFLSGDSSRDLNSAFIAAVQGVTDRLKESQKAATYGTVVTMTRGPDLAARKSDNKVRGAVTVSGFDFYSVTPEKMKLKILPAIGKTRKFQFATIDTLPMKLLDVGVHVRDTWFSHYLLTYCTPSRAGKRKLKIQVKFEDHHGKKTRGSSRSSFYADGFDGGCVPKTYQQKTPVADSSQPASASQSAPTDKQEQAPESGEDAQIVAPPDSSKYE